MAAAVCKETEATASISILLVRADVGSNKPKFDG